MWSVTVPSGESNRMATAELAELGEEEDQYTRSTSTMRKKIKAMTGFDIMADDAGTQFKDIYDIVVGIGEKWGELDDITHASILEMIGGKRGVNSLAAVMNNIDRVKEIYATAENAEGSAMKENEAYQRSVQASIEKAKAQLQELAADFMSSDLLKGLIDGGRVFLDIADQIISKLSTVQAVIGGITVGSLFKGLVLKDPNALVPNLFKSIARIGFDSSVTKELGKSLTDAMSTGGLAGASGIIKDRFSTIKDAAEALSKVKGIDASDELNLLAMAFETTTDAADKATKAVVGATSGITGISKIDGAINAVKNFGSGIISLATTHPIITATVVALSALVFAFNKASNEQKKAIEGAKEGAKGWETQKASLDNYIEKFTELRQKLDSGDLSETETVAIKSELLDLQRQIVAEYGNAAEGINLVNGNLEKQLEITRNISAEQAEANLRENANNYQTALSQIYNTGSHFINYDAEGYSAGIRDRVKDYLDQINEISFVEGTDYSWDQIVYAPDVDVTEAKEKVGDVLEYLHSIEREMSAELKDSPASQNMLQNYIDTFFGEYNRLAGISDSLEPLRKAALDALVSSVGGSTAAKEVKDASKELNNAILSGESDAIDENIKRRHNAILAYNDYIQKAIDSDYGKQFNLQIDDLLSLIDELSSIDEAGLQRHDFTEIMKGMLSGFDLNIPKKSVDSLKDIKKAALDIVDVRNIFDQGRPFEVDILGDAGTKSIESQLFDLAEAFGVVFEDGIPKDQAVFENFLGALAGSGAVFDATGSAISAIGESVTGTEDNLRNAIKAVSSLTTILSESASATGVSEDNLKAFRALFGEDAEKAIERTSNGIHLNQAQVNALQEQYAKKTKSEYLATLNDQYKQLANLEDAIAKRTAENKDTSTFEARKNAIQANITSLKDLISQYDGATSAYNKWVQAQAVTDQNDMYSTAFGAYDDYKKQLDNGWLNNGIREWISMMTGMKNASTATYEEISEKFRGMKKTLTDSRFSLMDFYDVKDGAVTVKGLGKFFTAVSETFGKDFANLGENGWEFNFSDKNLKAITDKWDIGPELIDLIVRSAIDAGMNVNFGEDYTGNPQLPADQNRRYLQHNTGAEYKFSELDLDDKSFESLKNGIELVDSYLQDSSYADDKKGIEAAKSLRKYLADSLEELEKNTPEEIVEENTADHERKKGLIQNKENEQAEKERQEQEEARKAEEAAKQAIERQEGLITSTDNATTAIEGATDAVNGLESAITGKTKNGLSKDANTPGQGESTPDSTTQEFKEGRQEPKGNGSNLTYTRPDQIEDLLVDNLQVDAVSGAAPSTGNQRYTEPIGPQQPVQPNPATNFFPQGGYYPDGTQAEFDEEVGEAIIDAITGATPVYDEEENPTPKSVDIETGEVNVTGSGSGEQPLSRKTAVEAGQSTIGSYGSSFQDWIDTKPQESSVQKLTDETEDLGDTSKATTKQTSGLSAAMSELGVAASNVTSQVNGATAAVTGEELPKTTPSTSSKPTTSPVTTTGSVDAPITKPVIYEPDTSETDAATAEAEEPVEQPIEQTVTQRVETVLGEVDLGEAGFSTQDMEMAVDVVTKVTGQEDLEELKKSEDGLLDKTIEATAKAIGQQDVEALVRIVNALNPRSVTVTASAEGYAGVHQLVEEINRLPTQKTVTITTIQQTINKGTANPSGGGTKRLDGTAHAQGTAHAGGKWGLEQDEDNTLINELGEEIIVRGDRWFTVNNGKPAITSLKRDDIVFNHKQSEELLKRGYVSSGHGRMVGRSYANGKNNNLESIGEEIGRGIVKELKTSSSGSGATFATGGGSSEPKQDYSKSSSTTSSGSSSHGTDGGSTTKKSTGNTGNTDKSKSNADNLVDWIEILLERLAKSLERLKTAADLVDKYTSKIAKYNEAIAQVQTNIRKNEQAEAKYRQKAGSIKIFEKDKKKDAEYKKKIREGNLSIENISDENVRKKIDEYQKWYDKAIACRDTVTDLRLELIELSQTKLDSVVEYFDKFIDRLSTMSDYYEATSDYMEAVRGWGDAGAQRSSRTYMKQQLSQLEKQYAAYLKEYNSQIAKGAKNGGIDRGSTRDMEARKQLAEIKTSIVEAKTAIENVDDTIREIGNQRTEAVSNPYNAYSDFLSENASRWQAESDLFEAYNGRQSVNMLRKSALDTNTRAHNLEDLINEYEKTIKANLSEDIWKVGDVEYTNAITELEKYRAELANTKKEVAELNKQIIDTNWSNWKKGLEVLNHYQSSINSIVSLLDEFNTFNSKTAKITEYGQSQVNMRMVEMNNAREEVAKYVVALNKLNEEYAKGQRTQFEYEQKYRELYEGELSAAQKVQSARKSILDTVRRGIEAETKAMSDLINKRKEALQRQKEADDYARNMRDRNKEINKIRQQIAALSGDTTEETRAKILKLQADLQDKQQELEDTQRDHEYSVITQGLDDELEKFREVQDEKTEALTSSLKYQDQIIKDALKITTSDFKNTVTTIQSLADEYGISIPEALTNGFGDIDFAKLTGLDKLPQQLTDAVNAISEASQKVHDASQKWGTGEIVRDDDINGHDSGANADRSNTNNDTIEDRPTLVSEKIAKLQKEADNAKSNVANAKKAVDEYRKKMNDAKAALKKAEKEYNAIKDDKSVAWSRRKAAKDAYFGAKNAYAKSMVNYNTRVGAYNKAVGTYNTKKSALAEFDQAAADKMAKYSTAKKATEPYITVKKTPLRDASNAKGKEIMEIPAGKTVQFTGKKENNYYQVSYGGKTGWVYVGNIEEPPTLEPIVKTPKKTTKLGPSNDPIKKTTNKKTVKLGYAKGTKSSKKGLAFTDEEGIGTEAVLTKKGVLRQLDAGTMIFNKAQRENLWEMSKINATSLLRNVAAKTGGFTIQNTYGSLLTVNGNVDKEALPELQTILDLAVDKMRKSLSSTMIKNGFAKR